MMKRMIWILAFLPVLVEANNHSPLQDPPVPRAEYPQPQFQRESWQSLNGQWEFDFDDANLGMKERWAASKRAFSKTILVPYSFETPKSGINDPSFHPWVWYRRTFTIPGDWRNRRVLLHFGAVDYRAWVWVNGHFAGTHEGGHVPFWFDITDSLQEGANTLVVRAEDPPEDRSVPRGKQYWEPQSRGIFYRRTSGIWQPVWIEAAGDSYLISVRVSPTNDGVVRFEARVRNPQAGLELHVTVRNQQEVLTRVISPAGQERVVAAAQVREPRLWSLGTPNLYDLTIELRRGNQTADRVLSYFGFRSVSLQNGRFHLNDRPLYLKMLLDQGYWPESNLTPPTDDAIQYDIRMAKEMGFNGVRKHQKLEDPRFLYWADRMGFLVSSEMANAYVFNDDTVRRFTAEWVASMERDHNHPSVVMWIPINESWGVPDIRDPRQQAHLKALYALSRSLDGTRPVIDNDGWEHTDMTDLFGIHDYARTGDLLYEKYKDLGKPDAPVPANARPVLAPGYRYNGSPIFLSEFGGIAYIPAGQNVAKDAWGYSGIEKTQQEALDRLRGLYQAIARIPAIMGVCYTQITDVEQEINGLMTYDRKMKFDPQVIREINNLLR